MLQLTPMYWLARGFYLLTASFLEESICSEYEKRVIVESKLQEVLAVNYHPSRLAV